MKKKPESRRKPSLWARVFQRHANGRRMWTLDGSMLLDDQGNRSIFDDLDEGAP